MQLEELVRRIRRGDKSAIKELVATYGNAVYQRAFERTQDKELAREAARQTFGQFVTIVQQQPEDDGWSLWFGDLIERNISAYAQIGVDMNYIENELENELYDSQPALPQQAQSASKQSSRQPYAEKQPSARAAESVRDKGSRSSARSAREEMFEEPVEAHPHKRSGQGFTIVVLVIICLLLVWVVGGVAMTMKWIPYYDLGYSWFNASVFRLF
ncbi:MAG: hypothetical protein LLF75_06620 [Eubacteriales bacterium]|nr:hypothetical protein [Eubacteriales bacterium]